MKKKHFSLVELLIVVSVILILAAISFSIFAGVIARAKEAKAESQITMLRTAIRTYHSDYQMLPFTNTHSGSDVLVNEDLGGSSYLTLIAALSGQAGGGSPRRGNYLPPDPETGGFVDPWDNDYCIALDLDYNGTILSNKIYGWGNVVADHYIWSKGKDGKHAQVDTDPANDDNLTL